PRRHRAPARTARSMRDLPPHLRSRSFRVERTPALRVGLSLDGLRPPRPLAQCTVRRAALRDHSERRIRRRSAPCGSAGRRDAQRLAPPGTTDAAARQRNNRRRALVDLSRRAHGSRDDALALTKAALERAKALTPC